MTDEREFNGIGEENEIPPMPIYVKPFAWVGKKTGMYTLLDKYVDRLIDPAFTLYSRTFEIGGTGIVGYNLGKLSYSSSDEAAINGLARLVTGASIALMGGALDLVDYLRRYSGTEETQKSNARSVWGR